MQGILPFVQVLISCLEVWMCYELLYGTILEKGHMRKRDKTVIYGDIIVWGMLMAYNHRFAFFSRGIFYLSMIVTALCAYVIKKEKILLTAGIVILYYSLLAVFDFFVVFSSMYYLQHMGIDFEANVYLASTYIQAFLLLISRLIMFYHNYAVEKSIGGV